jgi:hypothetical protein
MSIWKKFFGKVKAQRPGQLPTEPNLSSSEVVGSLIDAIRRMTFNELTRTLELEGPFGAEGTMALLMPRTFHTLRGARAGLAAIARRNDQGKSLDEIELLALAQAMTDAHGITSFFHAGRVPLSEELNKGGAPVLPPDYAFTENAGHFLDDKRPSLWIVYESEVQQLVKRLDIALTKLGWRVETDYKHEDRLLNDMGHGWGLVVRELVSCDAALSVRTNRGLRSVNSFGGIQGKWRGIQYELETLQLVRKPYPTTLAESWHDLSDEEFGRQVADLNQLLKEDFYCEKIVK